MENGIYLGLSRQLTLKNNLDVVANNVANMNTPGFRSQHLLFNEFISDPRGADDELSFVLDKGQYQNTEAGPVTVTGNNLDVAIDGPGFLRIQGPGGQDAYTRAGNFQIDGGGFLVTSSGFKVSDNGGGVITIPPGTTEISIDERGYISTQDGEIAQLGVFEFENLQALEPIGYNMYATKERPGQPLNSKVQQGVVEGSNVKPVVEMTKMIDTLRSFQSVQNVLQSENDRLRDAIQKLTESN